MCCYKLTLIQHLNPRKFVLLITLTVLTKITTFITLIIVIMQISGYHHDNALNRDKSLQREHTHSGGQVAGQRRGEWGNPYWELNQKMLGKRPD